MRRLAKERKALEAEVKRAEDADKESWFFLRDADKGFKWTIDIQGPEFYAINPDPKRQEKGEQRPSPYAGGVFPVVFEFKPTYPMTPPKVFFGCPVYHPQIKQSGSDAGHFCADFVKTDWKPNHTVLGVLEKVHSMLAQPVADGGLEADVCKQFTEDIDAYDKAAADMTKKHCC